ncbi:hypothetical protein SRHO_G00204900 [Serrasalmus rhombeus]
MRRSPWPQTRTSILRLRVGSAPLKQQTAPTVSKPETICIAINMEWRKWAMPLWSLSGVILRPERLTSFYSRHLRHSLMPRVISTL